MSAAPLANFIVAGVQKGGTTALHDYLTEHPHVTLANVKEVHFFDDESQDWAAPDYGAFHAHFPTERRAACGEITPIYIYWPNSLERIAAYNPAMKIVVLLRDPVERAFSQWRMEASRGAETHAFSWCIRQGRARLFDAEPWGHHREFSYVERGFYGEQIERLFSVFPREQTLILRSDALELQAAPTLETISAFLGVPPPPPLADRRVHVGAAIEGAELAAENVTFLRGLYERDMQRLQELTGISFW